TAERATRFLQIQRAPPHQPWPVHVVRPGQVDDELRLRRQAGWLAVGPERRRQPSPGDDLSCVRQRPKTRRRPDSTLRRTRRSSAPRRSSRSVLSRVTTWDTFTTESLGSPPTPAVRATLPGAPASRRFEVIVTHTTVAIRLRLYASLETTRTGRRRAGAEPLGAPRSAHQTSPRWITKVRPPPAAGRPPARGRRPNLPWRRAHRGGR